MELLLPPSTTYNASENRVEFDPAVARASLPIMRIHMRVADESNLQWWAATLHNRGWIDHHQVHHGSCKAIPILDPINVDDAYGYSLSCCHCLQWHIWSYISQMYCSHWNPPGVSERMWSVNLDASIAGEYEIFGGHSCRPSDWLGAPVTCLGEPTTSLGAPGSAGNKSGSADNKPGSTWERRQQVWERLESQ